jgi:hypothetical protein
MQAVFPFQQSVTTGKSSILHAVLQESPDRLCGDWYIQSHLDGDEWRVRIIDTEVSII